MNNWFKRNGVHLAIAGIFVLICFFYCTPAFQGKTLGQSDVIGAQSTQKEINDYRAKDTTILWTNQIFGGMPTYQIWANYPKNITTHLINGLQGTFPDPVGTILVLLFGTYFLFNVLKLNPWLAAAGAVAFTFSSYNIILLMAGHANQALAIAFFAPILASILLTLRGQYILGGSLTALFLALEIRANHVQMTYYLLLALLILLGIELYHAIKGKTIQAFVKAVAFLAGATLLALLVNASILWSTYEYGKDSIRGKSNLTSHTGEASNGLEKDYAYEWSQGVAECFTFLVPNAYGGPSDHNSIDLPKSEMVKVFTDKQVPQEQAEQFVQQLMGMGVSAYWGEKPLTSGPFYFGAIICFLFVVGLLLVRSRLKWWVLAVVVLTMLLSFGKNFPVVSDIFFDYFPLYNKFRAVESILAVAGLCFPILAMLAVKEIIEQPDKKLVGKKVLIALGITGGITLILLAVPSIFLSFRGSQQQQLIGGLTQMFKSVPAFADSSAALANDFASALVKDRASLEQADALRTLIFIVVAFGIVWAFVKGKLNVLAFSIILGVAVLVDLWTVANRYLNHDSFQEKVTVAQALKPREVDQFIARDTDPDFRVFDATATFRSDSFNPFFHKSITGYSAARMKRYEEVYLNQFTKSINHDVLDMLNTKYIITADPKNQTVSMQKNEAACGNAWFVKSVKFADNADQEMQAISSFSPKDEAIVDKQYKNLVDEKKVSIDPNATIKLTHYSPDHMEYESSSAVNSVAVFSEIYYDKGWTMSIDGKEAPYFRADYLLRAAVLPVGNHKIKFDFHPASYYTGETLSLIASIILVLGLIYAAYLGYKNKPAAPAVKVA